MHRLHCACVGRSPQHDGNRILTKVEESQTTRAKFGPAVWQDMDCTSENSPKMSALKIYKNSKKLKNSLKVTGMKILIVKKFLKKLIITMEAPFYSLSSHTTALKNL